jgi:hypothetical protein
MTGHLMQTFARVYIYIDLSYVEYDQLIYHCGVAVSRQVNHQSIDNAVDLLQRILTSQQNTILSNRAWTCFFVSLLCLSRREGLRLSRCCIVLMFVK